VERPTIACSEAYHSFWEKGYVVLPQVLTNPELTRNGTVWF
jgi:hypothetical protein